MNHLLRELAPITDGGWEQLEDEARGSSSPRSRRASWSTSRAARLAALGDQPRAHRDRRDRGRAGRRADPPAGAPAGRAARALHVARAELDDIARGAEDADLDDLAQAARRIALAENVAVFNGWDEAGITGITAASPHQPIGLTEDLTTCPRHIARAVEVLLSSGVGGPYGLALGPEVYKSVVETTEHGGYPLFDHLRKILDGPLVWAPGVDGGVVAQPARRRLPLRLRPGRRDRLRQPRRRERSQLYFVESFSFRVATPEAAVALPAARSRAGARPSPSGPTGRPRTPRPARRRGRSGSPARCSRRSDAAPRSGPATASGRRAAAGRP